MCGIFAYIGHKPIPIIEVLKVLHILEKEQELGEKSPVGGHGAGIAYLKIKSKLTLEKIGKTHSSPVDKLSLQLKDTSVTSHAILGHVRRASPEFQDTIAYKECTQPYCPHCLSNMQLTLVSAHNGFLQNYNQLRNKLTQPHQFESEQIKLNDSEVLAHLYEELLSQTKDPTKATHTLYEQIEGNNTAVILTINKNEAHLHAVQKGKTRGLVVWTNQKGEVLICSRKKPVQKTLHTFIQENNLQEIIHITRNDSVNLQTHFTLNLAIQH